MTRRVIVSIPKCRQPEALMWYVWKLTDRPIINNTYTIEDRLPATQEYDDILDTVHVHTTDLPAASDLTDSLEGL